jgi:hypothetical protein
MFVDELPYLTVRLLVLYQSVGFNSLTVSKNIRTLNYPFAEISADDILAEATIRKLLQRLDPPVMKVLDYREAN